MDKEEEIQRFLIESKRLLDKLTPIRHLDSDENGGLILDPGNPSDREWMSDEEDGLV